MDEVIADKALLDASRLRELSIRRNGPGLLRLIVQALLYFGSGAALVLIDEPRSLAGLLLINAVVQFGFFGMLHEACHKTAFSSSRLCQVAGWIAALAQPMSPALMRAFHFEHHRHTHELARDPELAGLEAIARWPRGLTLLAALSGLPVLFARCAWALFAALVPGRLGASLWERVLPFVKPERRRRVAWEARLLVAIHLSAITAAIVFLPQLWRIYLGMAFGHAILSWYITCEHRGLAEDGSVLERTRSLRVPSLVRWLLWNMPYHAEHHGWPAIPFHQLPALQDEVREHLVHWETPLYLYFHGGRDRGQRPPAPTASGLKT